MRLPEKWSLLPGCSHILVGMSWKKFKLDTQVVLILIAVVLAVIVPVSGTAAEWFSKVTVFAVAFLFFLYGARLSPREALAGLMHWRLHLLILCFTYVVFPLIGLALFPVSNIVDPTLYLGILYAFVVPSTVNSSIAFTSIAGGNVAGAIVSASVSNLLGVILTPVLAMLLLSSDSGVAVSGDVFLKIAVQLLLPFALGQLSRPVMARIAASPVTKNVDRGVITMVVYSAFSAGMVQGVWTKVSVGQVLVLVVWAVVVIAFMLRFTKFVATRLGFNLPDQIAVQFCGTKKSLASGLPMATVIFGGADLGLIIVPLMIFHQIQLFMSAQLAGRYERSNREPATSADGMNPAP